MSKSVKLMMGKQIGASESPGLKSPPPKKNSNLTATKFVGLASSSGKNFRDQKY